MAAILGFINCPYRDSSIQLSPRVSKVNVEHVISPGVSKVNVEHVISPGVSKVNVEHVIS